MTRYLDEHERHHSFLADPKHNGTDYERSLVKNLSHMNRNLHPCDKGTDQAILNEEATAATQEMDRMKKVWDEMNAEAEPHRARK